MALLLQPAYSTSNSFADYTNMIIDDGTGTYDMTDNTGGYGTPNEERANLGLVITIEKKGYGNIADSEITYDNFTNVLATVSEWTIPVTVDGWYKITLIGVPIYDPGQSYDTNQVVAYNNGLYESATDGNIGNTPDSGFPWQSFSDLVDLRDNIGSHSPTHTIYSGELDKVLTSLGDLGYGNAVAYDTSKECSPNCYDDINQTNKIWAYLEGAKISEARAKYMEAERKVLIYTDIIAGKDCKNC